MPLKKTAQRLGMNVSWPSLSLSTSPAQRLLAAGNSCSRPLGLSPRTAIPSSQADFHTESGYHKECRVSEFMLGLDSLMM